MKGAQSEPVKEKRAASPREFYKTWRSRILIFSHLKSANVKKKASNLHLSD